MPHNSFKDISSVLKNIVTTYDLAAPVTNQQIFDNWEKLVGKKFARLCTPVALNEDELTVKTVNVIWKQELALLHEDLVTLLNDRLNTVHIKKIKIVSR